MTICWEDATGEPHLTVNGTTMQLACGWRSKAIQLGLSIFPLSCSARLQSSAVHEPTVAGRETSILERKTNTACLGQWKLLMNKRITLAESSFPGGCLGLPYRHRLRSLDPDQKIFACRSVTFYRASVTSSKHCVGCIYHGPWTVAHLLRTYNCGGRKPMSWACVSTYSLVHQCAGRRNIRNWVTSLEPKLIKIKGSEI
jgi:hypothetical protein